MASRGVARKCLALAALLLVADAAQLRSGSHHHHHREKRQVPKGPGGPGGPPGGPPALPAAVVAAPAPATVVTVAAGAPSAAAAASVSSSAAVGLTAAAPAPASAGEAAGAPAPSVAADAATPAAAEPAPPAGVAPQAIEEPAAAPVVSAPAEETSVEEMEATIDKMVEAEKEIINPKDPVSQLKEELAATEWLEDQLSEKLTDMKEEVYRAKIVSAEQTLAKETGSPGTAQMLGDMRLQMHALAAPFYNKVLEEEMEGLQDRKKSLVEKIEKAEANKTSGDLEEEAEKVEKEAEEEATGGKKDVDVTWQLVLVVLLVTLAGIATHLAFSARRQARA